MIESNSSWLADGVKEIERIVAESMIVEPKLINVPHEKEGTYGVVTPSPSGKPVAIDFRVAGPKWHSETLENPAQLHRFIESMRERDVKPEDGAIYIGENEARYVYSFEDRRNRATCPLVFSDPWKWLAGPKQPLDQRTIIRLLRITFDGCLSADSNLVSTLRNIKWKTDGGFEGNIQRGKEALGRQVMNEVLGVANFPDEFGLMVNVFENYRHPVLVRVALEILPDVQKFELIPFPNQIHDGLAATLLALQADLSDTNVPTFIGSV